MIQADDMFKAFESHREDSVVIVTGTGGKHWADHTTKQNRDLNMGGAMGHTTSAALGLALGLPDEKVVLFDSEGALLMNLGIIATIAGQKPKNFLHLLMDNECYATTGGQPVPNAENISYAGMAHGAGYVATYEYEELEDFSSNVEGILSRPGPVFIAMKITPEIENEPIGRRSRTAARPRAQIIKDLRGQLGVAV